MAPVLTLAPVAFSDSRASLSPTMPRVTAPPETIDSCWAPSTVGVSTLPALISVTLSVSVTEVAPPMSMATSVSIVPERLTAPAPALISRSSITASLMRISPTSVVSVNWASAPATSLIVELLSNRMSAAAAAAVSMTRSAPRVTVSVPVRSTVPVPLTSSVVTSSLSTSTSALTSSPDSAVPEPTVVVKVTVPVGASAVSVDGPSTKPTKVTLPLSLLTFESPSTATELFKVTSPSLPLIVPSSVVAPVTATE